jgi:hypothetical protein
MTSTVVYPTRWNSHSVSVDAYGAETESDQVVVSATGDDGNTPPDRPSHRNLRPLYSGNLLARDVRRVRGPGCIDTERL